MKLNTKFYKGTDNYSDGDIENTIIKYIKSGKSVDEILKKDSSWPVYYHLASNRQNILNWYPFKKNAVILEIGAGMGAITPYLCSVAKRVVSVESSKRRASAIDERTKNFNNLEIVVGNFNDIKFEEKFDYVTLIGVYECALMFTDNKENAYVELLEKVKKLLKPNGKILIAIENRFGLKYWCGAKEDHTNIVFDGINNYASGNQFVRTFSKADLEDIFKSVKLNCNFYYPLPDYKFPELILTDEILKENNNHVYNPYYSQPFNMFANERQLFTDVLKNNELSFFANSYFIELSEKAEAKEVTYAKFNGYRKADYALITYKKDDKYYKKAINEDGIKHIMNIVKYADILKGHKINHIPVYLDKTECYTNNYENTYSLMDRLIDLVKVNKIDEVIKEINKYVQYLYNHFDTVDVSNQKTIFDKYNVRISKTQKGKLNFVKDGFVDLCFQNIILNNDKYVLIDQEWYEENVPLEFIVYRSIHLLVFDFLNAKTFNAVEDTGKFFDDLLKLEGIYDYKDIFNILDNLFIENVIPNVGEKNAYLMYVTNHANFEQIIDNAIYLYDNNQQAINEYKETIDKYVTDLNNKNNQIEELINMNNNLKNDNEIMKKDLNNIINSKRFKFINKLCNVKIRNVLKK